MTPGAERTSAPEHLRPDHELAAFDSGVPVLDDWLKRRALVNEELGGSRTYVVTAGGRVVDYYALATGGVAQAAVTGRVRRNMPDPVPVMVSGRPAVDRAYQGRGLGEGLLRDAVLRTLQAAQLGGIRAILVRAMSEEAKRFYERHGFVTSPIDPMALMITVADPENTLRSSGWRRVSGQTDPVEWRESRKEPEIRRRNAMSGPLRVVHYVNQFFGGIGGEDQAHVGVTVRAGAVGPGRVLETALGDGVRVEATIICGDNFANERAEDVAPAGAARIGNTKRDLVSPATPRVSRRWAARWAAR